jgi:hypothetical protein
VVWGGGGGGGVGGGFAVTKVLRSGEGLEVGAEVKAALPLFSSDGGKMGRGVVLLTRQGAGADWVIRAPASGLHQVAFYQKVLSMPEDLDEVRRAAFFARYLHHADAVLARAAAAEISSAPYAALGAMGEKLDAEKIRAALEDPAAGDRRALWYTLLGVCGDEADAVEIGETVETMWAGNGWRNLAAVLTAYLELEGEGAVDEIEAKYFRDRERTLPEIEAAILALRVHGDADGVISRDRALESFRSFFEDREPLVFLIVPDLARWEDWESKDRLVALAERRGDEMMEIRQRVNEYLELCPK